MIFQNLKIESIKFVVSELFLTKPRSKPNIAIVCICGTFHAKIAKRFPSQAIRK